MPQKRTIPRTCEQCGKGFLAAPKDVKRGWGRFCSRSCRARMCATKGRQKTTRGYYRVLQADGSTKYEHDIVMERQIGRPLQPGEIVHHDRSGKEGRGDNDPRNLVLMTQAEHARLHMAQRMAGKWSLRHERCVVCGTTETRHEARGMCVTCYEQQRTRRSHH